jgi:serine/threonine protein phosphatase PrpC
MNLPGFDILMASRTGQGQRSNNEDTLCTGQSRGGWYAVVADGAGGHSRGAEASRRAVQTIEQILYNADESVFLPETLSRVVRVAHAELQRHQVPGDPSASMHTTVVALWIDAGSRHALWAHVGDSRLYRLRHGLVDMVTTDDSLVQQMVNAGLISSAQARQHPHKNQLVAALGVEGDVDPHTVVRPVEVKDGDAFLLCSDGWWDAIDPLSIASTLERAQSPDDWLARMERLIEQRNAPRQDNFSAVAVWAGNPTLGADDSSDVTVPNVSR